MIARLNRSGINPTNYDPRYLPIFIDLLPVLELETEMDRRRPTYSLNSDDVFNRVLTLTNSLEQAHVAKLKFLQAGKSADVAI